MIKAFFSYNFSRCALGHASSTPRIKINDYVSFRTGAVDEKYAAD